MSRTFEALLVSESRPRRTEAPELRTPGLRTPERGRMSSRGGQAERSARSMVSTDLRPAVPVPYSHTHRRGRPRRGLRRSGDLRLTDWGTPWRFGVHSAGGVFGTRRRRAHVSSDALPRLSGVEQGIRVANVLHRGCRQRGGTVLLVPDVPDTPTERRSPDGRTIQTRQTFRTAERS